MDKRWQQIEELFHAAREQAPEERATFLERRCAGDDELRREIEELLARDAESKAAVDRPAWDGAGDLLESSVDAPLAAGVDLGPYRIVSVLGTGGMGRVYRAQDPRLGRSVAVKTSRERFTERFEREARAIAALNHPNICTLYDVGPNYLVMELVEGPTLADRIKKGPVPLQEALNIARQIADALEAAHDAGIVHRDLKPGNIKIRPDGAVKVLDFGLAKVSGPPISPAEGSPALLAAASEVGMIVGTAAYMSPEQARGERVDKRTDIWAFGAVFYEMLTGKRLFTGDTASDVLASVLREEPDLSKVPLKARKLIASCLEKDPRKRLRDIGDALRLLPEDEPEKPARKQLQWLWPTVAAAAVVVATVGLFQFRNTPAATARPITFQIVPSEISGYSALTLAPGGSRLAFSAIGFDGIWRLWVRNFDSVTARSIPEADGIVGAAIWSPDGRSLAFATGGKLKKIDISGGPSLILCDWSGDGGPLTGAWGNDVIVFSRPAGGLRKVSSSGGVCSDLTADGRFPSMLPDGKHFLYFRNPQGEGIGLYVASLDSTPHDPLPERILENQSPADFVQSTDPSHGYLLYNLRQPGTSTAIHGTLVAQPFDAQRMKLLSGPVNVPVSFVGGFGNAASSLLFTISSNGTLAYSTNGTGKYQNVWFDRKGKVVGTAGDPGDYGDIALSPDGTLAAYHDRQGTDDLWLFDFVRRISTRLTTGPDRDHQAVWSPDGRQIIWAVQKGGMQSLYVKASNGAGEERLVTTGEPHSFNVPGDWSPDGRFLLYVAGALPASEATGGGVGRKLWVQPVQPDGTPAGAPSFYLDNPLGIGHARFSPNGRWVAYTIGTAEAQNVYVSPFPMPPGRVDRWAISSGGGYQPLWRHDGKELFYLSPDGTIIAVDVNTTSPTFQSGTQTPLFKVRIAGGALAAPTHRWDVAQDGQRFLVVTVLDVIQSPPITVVTSWESMLKP